MKEMLDTI